MAVIAPVIDRLSATPDESVLRVTWPAVTEADTCTPVSFPAWCERTAQVFGTFGAGGAVTMQGSNDGTNFATMNNRQGAGIVVTAAGLATSQDLPVWVRPLISAGTGVSVSIVLALHRQDFSGTGR